MDLIEATDLPTTYRPSLRTRIHQLLGVDPGITAREVAVIQGPSGSGTTTTKNGWRWPSSRLLWLVPGLAIGLLASAQAGERGVGLAVLLLFGIVPHLPVLLGIGRPHAPGQLPRRAVPLYNLLHHPLAPLVLLGLAAAGILSPLWLVGALAWLSHIVADLAFGHGLRTPDGWRRPWWAWR